MSAAPAPSAGMAVSSLSPAEAAICAFEVQRRAELDALVIGSACRFGPFSVRPLFLNLIQLPFASGNFDRFTIDATPEYRLRLPAVVSVKGRDITIKFAEPRPVPDLSG